MVDFTRSALSGAHPAASRSWNQPFRQPCAAAARRRRRAAPSGDLSEVGEVDGRGGPRDRVRGGERLAVRGEGQDPGLAGGVRLRWKPFQVDADRRAAYTRELERVDESVIASVERVGPVPARARDSGQRLALHLLVRVALVDERL